MAPVPTNDETSSSDSSPSYATLSASYKNSSTPAPITQLFSLPISAPIPAVGSGSVEDKTAYLSELRTSTKKLQEDINAFLTQKMEEDKLHAVTNGGNGQEKGAGKKTMDEVDEEKYGEEEVEDNKEG